MPEVQKVINSFTPTVYSVSNDQVGTGKERPASTSSGSESNASSDDLGDVLNSIENRLGLAAIENGQHQDGINLLRYVLKICTAIDKKNANILQTYFS